MEELRFIDDLVHRIAAPPATVWPALIRTLGARMAIRLPRPVIALWGLRDTARSGAWDGAVAVGDTLPGFHVADSAPPHQLTLRGSHRFARYELRFALDTASPDGVAVHATTFATFPGVLGRLYRALVIGSGGHRIVVRRMLASIARRARRGASTRAV